MYHHTQIKPLTNYFKVSPPKLTHPTKNPQTKTPKKSESMKLTMTAKKLSVQKTKPPDMEEEEKIRKLLDENNEDDKQDNTCTKNISEHIENNSTVKIKTTEEKWDTRKNKLKCRESKPVDDNSTRTKETIDNNKKSLWNIIAENENEKDRLRVESTKKRLTGLQALSKNELLTDDDSSDSCSEQVENVTESKNVKKPENIQQDLSSPIPEQVDNVNKSSSNLNTVNNCKVNKSPSPEKSNILESGQKKILDYFSRKN